MSATVANAILMKAFLLDNIKQPPFFEEIVRRYGNRDEADISSPVAWALWSLAGCFERQGRKDEALAMHRQALHHFERNAEPSLTDLLELVQSDIQRLTDNP